MNAVMAQLATLATKSNNLRIHNFMLQDLVNVFERRVEAFEGREEDHRVLREALGQVVGVLVFCLVYRRVCLHDQNYKLFQVVKNRMQQCRRGNIVAKCQQY